MSDSVPTRPLVAKAVRLLANPRSSAADTGLVTAVALRLAALDSSGETATQLVTAADQVVSGVAEILGSKGGTQEWGDTAEAIALLLADRPVSRRHLVSVKSTLGSGDKLLDLADRLRSATDERLDADDLARALAAAVTAPVELLDAISTQSQPRRARREPPAEPLPQPIPLRRTGP
jgi:hypothetical protein